MKLYDKMVFVPSGQDGHFEVRQFGFSPFEETYRVETNVVVLTIEEAKELWAAGREEGQCALQNRTYEINGISPMHVITNFKTYLQSKGIQL